MVLCSVLQVVAPVRATCSQALGLVLGLLPVSRVKKAAMLLMHLAVRKEWEVRYSSLLAIQHLLAARAVSCVCVCARARACLCACMCV